MKKIKGGMLESGEELEREASLLLQLDHPNIVRFYGIAFKNDADGPPSHCGLLFEFMPDGDLVTFLQLHNPELEDGSTELSLDELLGAAENIADGLAYLASRELVHRDLAARNCLVRSESSITVKISDFGMSRTLPGDSYYKMGDGTLVPVRWLPPESLLYRKFTLESDIWSLGVLFWELFSLGQVPWGQYSNSQVISVIRSGVVLNRPERCPHEVYKGLLRGCWAQKPGERPTAAQVTARLRLLSLNHYVHSTAHTPTVPS